MQPHSTSHSAGSQGNTDNCKDKSTDRPGSSLVFLLLVLRDIIHSAKFLIFNVLINLPIIHGLFFAVLLAKFTWVHPQCCIQ